MNPRDAQHLSTEELLRALDDELAGSPGTALEAHLAACERCRNAFRELGALSVRIEAWVTSIPGDQGNRAGDTFREKLASEAAPPTAAAKKQGKGWNSGGIWHWAISGAVAATAVVAAMLSPGIHSERTPHELSGPPAAGPQSFQIAGETFVALPYSNADLPVAAPHIVQMEVPVISLAEAGIVLEPVSSEEANPDRAVLADVLLGADGEPLGVHVISGESE